MRTGDPNMKTIQKALLVLASLGFAASAYAAWPVPTAPDALGMTRLTEGKGITLIVGTKKAVATYLNEGGACKVSVMVSETYPDQIPYHLTSVRFGASVPGGSAADVETSDGAAMSLDCAPGGKALTIHTHDLAVHPSLAAIN